VAGVKYIPNQPDILALMNSPVLAGHDTCGILTTVLKHGQRIVKMQVNIRFSNDAYDTTHTHSPLDRLSPLKQRLEKRQQIGTRIHHPVFTGEKIGDEERILPPEVLGHGKNPRKNNEYHHNHNKSPQGAKDRPQQTV